MSLDTLSSRPPTPRHCHKKGLEKVLTDKQAHFSFKWRGGELEGNEEEQIATYSSVVLVAVVVVWPGFN